MGLTCTLLEGGESGWRSGLESTLQWVASRAPVAIWRFFLFFIGMAMIVTRGFAEAEPPASNRAIVDFEPNLPIAFLEAKQPVNSAQRVSCTLKMVCPKGLE